MAVVGFMRLLLSVLVCLQKLQMIELKLMYEPTKCRASMTYSKVTKLYSINDLLLIDSISLKGKHRSFSPSPSDSYDCSIDGYTGSWPKKAVCDFGSVPFQFPKDMVFGFFTNFPKFEELRKFSLFLRHTEQEWRQKWRESNVRKNMEERFAKKFDRLSYRYEEKDLYKLFD